MSRKTKNAIGGTIRVLILIFFFLLVVLPIYWIVVTSFKSSGEILDLNNITYFPKAFTWKNYTDLFEQFNYGVLLKNSLLVSVASALVVTVFSMLGGYSLARYHPAVHHFLKDGADQYPYWIVYLLRDGESSVLCHYDAEFL